MRHATYVLAVLAMLSGAGSVLLSAIALLAATEELRKSLDETVLSELTWTTAAGALAALLLTVLAAALASRGKVRRNREQRFSQVFILPLVAAFATAVPFAGGAFGLIATWKALTGRVPLSGGSIQHGALTTTYRTYYYPRGVGWAVGLAFLLTTLAAQLAFAQLMFQ